MSEIDHGRLKQLMFDHPSTCPENLTNTMRLVENPSVFAPTASLKRFRQFILERIAAEPEDPDWPKFLDCTDAALAFREGVPPEYRFWRSDPAN